MRLTFSFLALIALLQPGAAAQVPADAGLTMSQAIHRALSNSKDLALARMRMAVNEQQSGTVRAEFRPNLYTGSGAAYTKGIPQSPGGDAPSVFNVSYIQTFFNLPLKGQLKAAEERETAASLQVDQVRDSVIERTALSYLELKKVRRSLGLMAGEREAASRILEIARAREQEGLELPIELTRAELTAARVERDLVQLRGREQVLEEDLRTRMGMPVGEPVVLAGEAAPAPDPDRPIKELLQLAQASSLEIQQAEAEHRARQRRLQGEKGGYWPTLDLVGRYSILSRANNYDDFFNTFERHNVQIGVRVNIPIFSAKTSAAVSLARAELNQAEMELKTKRDEVEMETLRRARAWREAEAGHEVARLELKLARQQLAVRQAQFDEGQTGLQDVEKSRLEESQRWLAFLDAEYAREQARLQLLQITGRLQELLP